MALKLCPECKKEVSERATRCPHCGFQRYRTTNTVILGVFLLLLALGPRVCLILAANGLSSMVFAWLIRDGSNGLR
jgi:uncharacterized paraquat-inducible protein A